jgi:phage-related protein
MGFFGDLWGGFTGDAADDELDKGVGAVNANTGKATGAITAGADKAQSYLSPYVQQGGRAYGMYGDALGVNGADARARAQGIYTSDPILQQMRDLDAKRSGWAFNARGGYGSGAHALASNRAMLENYANWQNRLAQAGQEGQAAATGSANFSAQAGRDLAGAYGQSSNALASLYGEKAKAQNTFAQNMLGLGGLAVQAYTGMPKPKTGNDIGK